MGNVVRQENYRLIGKMGTPEHEEYELERVGDLIQQARKQRNMTQEKTEKRKFLGTNKPQELGQGNIECC